MVKRGTIFLATVLLSLTFLTQIAVAAPGNEGCVGAGVSHSAQNGDRSTIVHNWHQTSAEAGIPNGQWGVNWMRSHCGIPGGTPAHAGPPVNKGRP
jgi:hypothetical protein